jgi:hypothetical protein
LQKTKAEGEAKWVPNELRARDVLTLERRDELIILLASGDKSTQQQDIRSALALAKEL